MVALATTFPYVSIWSLSGKPSLLLLQDWYLKSTYDTGRRESHYVNVVHSQLPHRHSLRDIYWPTPSGVSSQPSCMAIVPYDLAW